MTCMQASETGRVVCGGSFLDIYGRRPPATIQVVHSTGTVLPPHLASWSAFPAPKKIRAQLDEETDGNTCSVGEHVALVFPRAAPAPSEELLFTVGIFRCDTWALEWGVRAESLNGGMIVSEVCCLSAHVVVFLVEHENKACAGCCRELYIATRADIARVTRREKRQWRSFLADAHAVKTSFEDEGLSDLRALSATSCLVLTGTGRLLRLTVSLLPQVTFTSEEVVTKGSGLEMLRGMTTTPKLAVSSAAGQNLEQPLYAAVFVTGGHTCCVVRLAAGSVGEPQCITLPAGTTLEWVDFAGPYILVAAISYSDKSTFALHFTSLVPSELPLETAFSCISFDPIRMTACRVPVATLYNAENETQTLLVERRHGTNTRASEGGWWSCMEYTELPLHEGPYTEETFLNATWVSFPEPSYTPFPIAVGVGAGDNNGNDDGDDDDDDQDDTLAFNYQRNMELLSHRQSAEDWKPLRLHYALVALPVSKDMTDAVPEGNSVTVLAIETVPFLHSRLGKQWHNAARGLHLLLDSESPNNTVGGFPPFAVAWNPVHIRQALQLFSQERLCMLFTKVVNALRCSTQGANATELFYGAATSAVTDTAMQIIMLSRQVGAHLKAEDVEVLVLLLRASRGAGHLIVDFTARVQLLLESIVRSRVANRLLGREKVSDKHFSSNSGGGNSNGSGFGGGGGDDDGDEAWFLNLPDKLRTERFLHTKYAANAWAQSLVSKRSEHSKVVVGALELLNVVSPNMQQQQANGKPQRYSEETVVASPMLPDWMTLGRYGHADASMREYESALLHTGELSS